MSRIAALSAVIEAVNKSNSRRVFPSSQRRGGRASLIDGAPGAKREPDRAKPQLMVGSANLFSPEDLAELTTITASRYRARASRPSAALSVASHLRLMPQPPLLCEEGNILPTAPTVAPGQGFSYSRSPFSPIAGCPRRAVVSGHHVEGRETRT